MIETKLDYEGINLQLMNTTISIFCHSNEFQKSWKSKMAQWFSYVSKEWSRFDINNSLGRFNNSPINTSIQVSPLLFDILYDAQRYAEQTNYYFNPFLLNSIEELGYNCSFPLLEKTRAAKSHVGNSIPLKNVLEFEHDTAIVKKKQSCQVDLGGIAKGWSVNYAVNWLRQIAKIDSGFVNAGGDLIAWSSCNEPWNISIPNPYNESETIVHLKLANGAIATSNILYRRWKQDQKEYHHILNGRTGLCAESDVIQVTMIGPSLIEAEVLTKVLIILGLKNGAAWLKEKFPHVSYLAVLQNGVVIKGGNQYGLF